jgi:hypothetical protein
VANHELGFELPVRQKDVGLVGILQWYAYWSVLLKARKLEKHFIKSFSTISNFTKDVPRSVLNNRIKSMITPYVHVMDHVGAQNILNSIERKSEISIFKTPPDRLLLSIK